MEQTTSYQPYLSQVPKTYQKSHCSSTKNCSEETGKKNTTQYKITHYKKPQTLQNYKSFDGKLRCVQISQLRRPSNIGFENRSEKPRHFPSVFEWKIQGARFDEQKCDFAAHFPRHQFADHQEHYATADWRYFFSRTNFHYSKIIYF